MNEKLIIRLSVCFLVGFSLAWMSARPDGLQQKTVSFKTGDGLTIRATLGLPKNVSGKVPAVILVHQGGSDRSEWDGFFDKLLAWNYVVLAYDVRGHGQSDKVKSIYALFNDPNQAPRDLRAALGFLKAQAQVNTNRIGVVGASIGSNLACVASSEMGIKTAVAISGKTSAVFNLAGKKELNMRSVFYISSAGDQGGQRAVWAKEMFEQTESPRRIEIVKNSSAHGVSIFRDAPQVEEKILEWLKQRL